MKHHPLSSLSALVIACVTGACSVSGADPLSDRKHWSEDFTRRSPSTPTCPGGSVTALTAHMDVIGPHTLASFEQMAARATPRDREAETTARFPHAVSAYVKEQLMDSDRIHAFDFTTDPNISPWWGFHGFLIARGDCIIHVEVTGYDHG